MKPISSLLSRIAAVTMLMLPTCMMAEPIDSIFGEAAQVQCQWQTGHFLQWSGGELCDTQSDIVPDVMLSDYIDIRGLSGLYAKGLHCVNALNPTIAAYYGEDMAYISSEVPAGEFVNGTDSVGWSEIWKPIEPPADAAYMRIEGNVGYDTKLFCDFYPQSACSNVDSTLRGKKIAFFGGSFSVQKPSKVLKNYLRVALGAECVMDFGVGGAGFAQGTCHPSLPNTSVTHQVRKAIASGIRFDICVLWASTNDFNAYPCEIGTPQSYTDADSYAPAALHTQCGGINAAIKLLREHNPDVQILFMGSLPFFSQPYGYNLADPYTNVLGYQFVHYIDAQAATCAAQGIPYLDQWSLCGIDADNYKDYYNPDDNYLHPLRSAYLRWLPWQADFICNPEEYRSEAPVDSASMAAPTTYNLKGILAPNAPRGTVVIRGGKKILVN